MANDEEVVFFQVPAEVATSDLVDGLASASVLPRLRGGGLEVVATIAFDSVTIASGMVTIAVASEELKRLVTKMVGQVRRRGDSKSNVKASVSTPPERGHSRVMVFELDDPQLAEKIIAALKPSATDPVTSSAEGSTDQNATTA